MRLKADASCAKELALCSSRLTIDSMCIIIRFSSKWQNSWIRSKTDLVWTFTLLATFIIYLSSFNQSLSRKVWQLSFSRSSLYAKESFIKHKGLKWITNELLANAFSWPKLSVVLSYNAVLLITFKFFRKCCFLTITLSSLSIYSFCDCRLN